MIRYSLRCAQSHDFESWFQSAAAFDRLAQEGHVTCPLCGDRDVVKALMTPSVMVEPRSRGTRAEASETAGPMAPAPAASGRPPSGGSPHLRGTPSDLERQLAELRDKVERESDYVGLRFAAEARAMHDGTAPERPIWGEARADDARKLIEDGVPVAPLPFVPRRKAH